MGVKDPRRLRTSLRYLSALLILAAGSAAGAGLDRLTIGSVPVVPSGTARLPVFIRDVGGTQLNVNGAATIQILQFRITFPSNAIAGCTSGTFPNCQVAFTPAGVFAGLKPSAAELTKSAGSISVRYEFTDTIPFDLDASAPGNLVAYLSVTLSPSVKSGDSVVLALDHDGDATFLGHKFSGGGSVIETDGDDLELVDGTISVSSSAASCAHLTGSNSSLNWLGETSGCTPLGADCGAGENIAFSVVPFGYSFTGCEAFRWSFGDGSVGVGMPAKHVYTSQGTFPIQVAVTTPDGVTVLTDEMRVGLSAVCPPENCSASAPTSAFVFSAVLFSAASLCSSASYSWNFGDEVTSSLANPAHKFTKTGVFAWTLTVTTSAGKCVRSGTIVIAGGPSTPPTFRRRPVRP